VTVTCPVSPPAFGVIESTVSALPGRLICFETVVPAAFDTASAPEASGQQKHHARLGKRRPARRARPAESGVTDADSKAKIVADVKNSFAYCEKMLAGADDARLSEQVPVFKTTRAAS